MKPYSIYGISNIEEVALEQFYSAMRLDYVVEGALMPDAHAGYALPIGAVVATKGKIVPAWVGYDIGCGMCAVPTSFDRTNIEANAKAIFDQIYRDVPVGFAHNKTPINYVPQANGSGVSEFVAKEIILSGAPGKQVGTLGGGNHFIEIGHDETDRVWIIVHSGSRNIGHKIATHYMKLASGDGKAREGHFALDVDSPEGKDYINDLAFGLQFALDNRKFILLRVATAIGSVLNKLDPNFAFFTFGSADFEQVINRNHNHAEFKMLPLNGSPDHVHGCWIHRKGATHAEEGMMGVIPGNMRDGSFIVRGKGNPNSLCSSSHGAGRVMGRKVAQERLSMDVFKETMSGVQARVDLETLDESPDAYKSIFDVMEMQRELIEVVHHIKPIINIKG